MWCQSHASFGSEHQLLGVLQGSFSGHGLGSMFCEFVLQQSEEQVEAGLEPVITCAVFVQHLSEFADTHNKQLFLQQQADARCYCRIWSVLCCSEMYFISFPFFKLMQVPVALERLQTSVRNYETSGSCATWVSAWVVSCYLSWQLCECNNPQVCSKFYWSCLSCSTHMNLQKRSNICNW